MKPIINRAQIERRMCQRDLALMLGFRKPSGEMLLVHPVFSELVKAGEAVSDGALISLDEEAAQCLVDELWRIGFRPVDAKAGDAQIAALTSHLDDMRVIVAHKLGVKLP